MSRKYARTIPCEHSFLGATLRRTSYLTLTAVLVSALTPTPAIAETADDCGAPENEAVVEQPADEAKAAEETPAASETAAGFEASPMTEATTPATTCDSFISSAAFTDDVAEEETSACTLTSGCTLEAGHEGDCVVASSDGGDGTGENPFVATNVEELVQAFATGGVVSVPGEITISVGQTLQVPAGVSVTLRGGGMLQRGKVSAGSNFLGALIEVAPGATLTLEDVTLDGAYNAAKSTGIKADSMLVLCHGNLVMQDGAVLQNNYAKQVGGAVRVSGTQEAYATFTMEGGVIRDNRSASKGGAVHAGSFSTFTMKGGTICGNAVVSGPNEGGAVYLSGYDTENVTRFFLEGGVISGNKATYGGAVKVDYGSELTMSGGEIANNSAQLGGGIVINCLHTTKALTFIMKGGAITGNKATVQGGGVNVNNFGNVLMEGGVISGNDAPYGGGGVAMGGTEEMRPNFVMKGGSICENNSAYYGGGAFVSSNSDFVLEDGSISGNTAANGGGVYTFASSGITLAGGSIRGNTACTGGGVFVGAPQGQYVQGGYLALNGGAITGNVVSNANGAARGGGVFVASGAQSFTMDGGLVYGNTLGQTAEGASAVGTDIAIYKSGMRVSALGEGLAMADNSPVTGWFVDGSANAAYPAPLWRDSRVHFPTDSVIPAGLGLIAAYCGDAGTAASADVAGDEAGDGANEATGTAAAETSATGTTGTAASAGLFHWRSVVEPTCTETGARVRVCDHCGGDYYLTETVSALGHKPGDAVQENVVEATYSEEGSYDLVVYCELCGEELSRTTTVTPKLVRPSTPVRRVSKPAVAPAPTPAAEPEPAPASVVEPEPLADTEEPVSPSDLEGSAASPDPGAESPSGADAGQEAKDEASGKDGSGASGATGSGQASGKPGGTTAGKTSSATNASATSTTSTATADTSGWRADTTDGSWHYAKNGAYVENGWERIDGEWYYFSKQEASTGWQKVDGKWYYLAPATDAKTGTTQCAATTGWRKIDGKWYYFETSTSAKAGTTECAMTGGGWHRIDGKWYLMDSRAASEGAVMTGWQKVGGQWYYLNKAGEGTEGAMRTGWLNDNGTWYYLTSSGAMARDTWVGNYYVNSLGARVFGCLGARVFGRSGVWHTCSPAHVFAFLRLRPPSEARAPPLPTVGANAFREGLGAALPH